MSIPLLKTDDERVCLINATRQSNFLLVGAIWLNANITSQHQTVYTENREEFYPIEIPSPCLDSPVPMKAFNVTIPIVIY